MSKVDYDMTRQMQKDLIKAYGQVCDSCWSQWEAYEKMIRQPAPRYYVSPKQAFQVISPMVKGNFEKVNKMQPRKRRMYYSLYRTMIRLSSKPSFYGQSLWYIMQFAVNEPAPEFFIGEQRARQIRRWLKKDIIDENGKVDDSKLKCYQTSRETKRKIREKKKRKKWMSEKI